MAKSNTRHLINTYVNSNKYCSLIQLVYSSIGDSYWKCRDNCKMKLKLDNHYYNYRECAVVRLEDMK